MDINTQQEVQPKIKDEVGVRCQKLFHDFLEDFREDGEVKYLPGAKALEDTTRCTLEVSFEDVERYNQNLATAIIEEFYRVYPYLCQALKNFVKDHGEVKVDRELFVGFVDVPTRHRIRELTSTKIGTLIRISGQVVRTHSVHPELVSGTFKCLDCQTVVKDVEQQFKFTQPTLCRNLTCTNRTRFLLDIDKSNFVDFQKIRIQETQAELPRGAIPRSMEVILRGESVELVQPGDKYDFTGTLMVVPNVGVQSAPGLKADKPGSKDNSKEQGVTGLTCLGVRELHYNMVFVSCSVTPTNARFGGSGELLMEELTPEIMKKNMTEAEWTKIYQMNQDKNLFNNLIASLFPTIHGCEQVKKGVLLMLFGGVPKTTGEGTTLRGDINCCLVGDPSTAKSQMLKLVADMSPRAVYTSGKATSAAGLTAAVVRDDETGEFVIEAGALMLADNGVCCIDEFDKMDPHDQVAIHEAMEQQTISIAKAGVRATLNSRTSILAAANPIYGKYDRTKSLQQNIQLSAPIMSRFDLFFVLIDECNDVIDYAIARKIVSVHSSSTTEEAAVTAYTPEEVLRYITFARQFKPYVSNEAGEMLVQYYVQLRQRDGSGRGRSTWRITVRQLESLIRLSEAMAKMECLDEVLERHVVEAFNLINKSIIRVEQPDINLGEENEDEPPIIENGIDHHNGENGHENGDINGEIVPKKKLKLSFEEYKQITNMLVTYIRSGEISETGISRDNICNWYLEQIAHTIESEEELVEKKGLIERVLDRLVHQDNILISIADSQSSGDAEEDEESALLVVHPNFMADD